MVVIFKEGIETLWTLATSIEGKEITFTDVTTDGIVTRTYTVL